MVEHHHHADTIGLNKIWEATNLYMGFRPQKRKMSRYTTAQLSSKRNKLITDIIMSPNVNCDSYRMKYHDQLCRLLFIWVRSRSSEAS
jgi:hypothetical protein